MSDGRILNPDAWGFMDALAACKGATTEGPVQNLWTGVLNELFPSKPNPASPRSCFRVVIKVANLASGGEPDAVLLEVRLINSATRAVNDGDWRARHVFIAECKSALEDTSFGWDSAEVQLTQYLEENINNSERLYAAIGIGTKVIFFKWDKAKGVDYMDQMTPMHLGALDFQTPAHRALIEEHFEEIKNHGWDRSLS